MFAENFLVIAEEEEQIINPLTLDKIDGFFFICFFQENPINPIGAKANNY